MPRHTRTALLLAAGAFALGACSHSAVLQTESHLMPKSARLMDDENIVAMTLDSDSSEVTFAQAVKPRLSDPRLRDFAQVLIDDHSRSLSEMKALAAAQHLDADRPPVDSIPRETEHLLERFNGMPAGASFDTAFVNHEVRDHHMDLGAVQSMAEWAKNEQLKDALNRSFPVLEKHLRIAESLGGKP